MIGTDTLDRVIGRDVYDEAGDKIGSASEVYLDDQTGQPEWVTVKTGLFGTKESFVPIRDADLTDDGVRVHVSKDKVKDAPKIDTDGHLSPQEEEELYRYYGLGGSWSGTEHDRHRRPPAWPTGIAGRRTATATARTTTSSAGTVGHDTSGPTTDNAMTRSEERLNVGTRSPTEAGRARLRKYVVTENVTQTVPVTREEVRLEREPITDANVGDALDGPAISEEEHEVVLHAERPVVEKEAVPVERVRLDKETVTDQETVTERSARSRSRWRVPRAPRSTATATAASDPRRPGSPGTADGGGRPRTRLGRPPFACVARTLQRARPRRPWWDARGCERDHGGRRRRAGERRLRRAGRPGDRAAGHRLPARRGPGHRGLPGAGACTGRCSSRARPGSARPRWRTRWPR